MLQRHISTDLFIKGEIACLLSLRFAQRRTVADCLTRVLVGNNGRCGVLWCVLQDCILPQPLRLCSRQSSPSAMSQVISAVAIRMATVLAVADACVCAL